jgi:hypothetical protein
MAPILEQVLELLREALHDPGSALVIRPDRLPEGATYYFTD